MIAFRLLPDLAASTPGNYFTAARAEHGEDDMNRDLRDLRIMAGMTQCDVARETGVDRSKLSLAENRYVELRPEEQAAIRKLLLETIENKAAELKGVLSGAEALTL
jgi:transcriptional regulator with XRE-family HTH domain